MDSAVLEQLTLRRLLCKLHYSPDRPVTHDACLVSDLFLLKTYIPRNPELVMEVLRCPRAHVFAVCDKLDLEFMETMYQYGTSKQFLCEKEWQKDHSSPVTRLLQTYKQRCLDIVGAIDADPNKALYADQLNWASPST